MPAQIKPYVTEMAHFLRYLVANGGVVEFGDPEDGAVYAEKWGYRRTWRIMRPRYYGFLKQRDCGCSYRFGKRVYTLMGCKEHFPTDWLEDGV